jgi:hypothetical protein
LLLNSDLEIQCFQNVIFYVVSDDSAWAENYFENSPAKDSETYFVGFGSESRGSFFHSNQQVFSQTDKIGIYGAFCWDH